jgi:hypothetical protein
MEPFDIFTADWPFKKSDDIRPWLIVESRGDLIACYPISGENYSGIGFELRKDHKDFPATGLKKRCYILNDYIFDIPLAVFKKHRGQLQNEFLKAFREYDGR